MLPVLTLLFASLAAGVRMVRAGMTEVLQTEYVQTARLNGVAERRVLWRYALRNALAPSVQVIAQNLQWLIGGIIITESVFAYPGIGTVLVNAVQNRDVTVVQSVAMLIAIVYVVAQPGRRPRRDAARAQAAGACVSERLRFLRTRSGAIGFGVVVFVVLVAMLRPVRRSARSARADRPAAFGPVGQGAPGHRLPRPRRAQPAPLRRPVGDRLRARRDRCSPTRSGSRSASWPATAARWSTRRSCAAST